MGSTRRSRPADRDPVANAVEAALAALAGRRVAVALSGGRDSAALLVACAAAAPAHAVKLAAIHVHHGLSPRADAWTAVCGRLAARCSVPLAVERVSVTEAASLGVEAAARAARYAALRQRARERGIAAILLAHHQDDQAETLLLQALRGAGPHGLAAMPATIVDGEGLAWGRPLLAVPRAAIDRFVAQHAIEHVDDESNASTRFRRNRLRHDVMPALLDAFPAASCTLARAATHQAEAATLLDDLAAIDAGAALRDGTLACTTLAALAPPRARNLLRWWLRGQGLRAPSAARLHAMLAQVTSPRADARIAIAHAGMVIGRHRGRLEVHAPPSPSYRCRWLGETSVALPHGELSFVRAIGEGIDRARLASDFVIRPREGGERLRLRPGGPTRALKTLLQERGVPAWERTALPLIVAGDAVVAVPGIGVDVRWRPREDGAGLVPVWSRTPMRSAT